MPEKEGKKDNIKQHEQKEQKEEKPSLWQKIKKPLAAGILAAGLLVTPMKRAESTVIEAIRGPPTYTSSYIDQPGYIEKRWKTGWKILLKGWDMDISPDQREIFYKASLNYFKNAYEKAKEKGIKHEIISAYYLYTWQTYALAEFEPTLKDTEKRMLEALEMVEKRNEEVPNDFDMVDLKLMIYYNLAEMYAGVALNDSLESAQLNIKYRRGDITKEECKKEAIKYINKYLKYLDEITKNGIINNLYNCAFTENPVKLSEKDMKDEEENYNKKKQKLEIYLKRLNSE